MREAAKRGLQLARGSLARAARKDAGATDAGRPSPAPESAPRARHELWDDPVPLMEDRDGHLHLLL